MLDEDQKRVVDAPAAYLAVYAGAGSGKTTVLVNRAARLSLLGKTLCLTFTSESGRNMRDRCAKLFPSSTAEFRTVHSLALQFANEHPDSFPFPLSDNPLAGDGVAMKAAFQATKNNINFRVFTAYVSLQKRKRISPVEAVQIAERTGKDLASALAFKEYQRLLKNLGVLDFDDLISFMVDILESRPDIRAKWQYNHILVDEAQDLSKIEWDLMSLLTRKNKSLMAVGDTGQCQPPGTMVQVVGSRSGRRGNKCHLTSVPIESLSVGDKVSTWYRRKAYSKMVGEKILEKSSRHYEGDLLTIHSGGKQTKVTPNHKFWATLSRDCRFQHITYIMYREGLGFRIGMCKAAIYKNNRNGVAGFTSRCFEERADMAWILRVWETREEAHRYELVTAAKFGVPTSVYCANKSCKVTQELINEIFAQVPLKRGFDCLEEHNLFFDIPLFRRVGGRPHSRYFQISACNLIPELMKLPAVGGCESEVIDKITREHYEGLVYSLDVEKDHTYIADGIVVGNSIYGFRGGISEHFLSMNDYFPGTQKLFLGKNYRSTKSIVSYVKNAAPFAEISEHFEAVSTEQGPEPVITGYSTDFMEAEGVVSKIALLPPNDCAVLARTNLALRSVEEILIERGIPHYLLNDEGFWDQPEVREMLAWIRCVQAPVDNCLLAALQTPFWPTQFIKRKLVAQEIREQITKQGKTAWVLLSNYRSRDDRQNQAVKKFVDFVRKIYGYRGLPAKEVVGNLLRGLKALEHYREESGICPDKDPVASLRELLRVSEKKDSLPDFLSYVRKVMGANRSRKGVVLSTIHSAKGREWDNVFLISCSEGILPHAKTERVSDEANCFYVAVSRAAKSLNISYFGQKSRFLK